MTGKYLQKNKAKIRRKYKAKIRFRLLSVYNHPYICDSMIFVNEEF